MNPIEHYQQLETRRQFFSRSTTGIGVAALSSLLAEESVLSASHFSNLSPRLQPNVGQKTGAAFSRNRQTRYLFDDEWRPLAHRPVRLQTRVA